MKSPNEQWTVSSGSSKPSTAATALSTIAENAAFGSLPSRSPLNASTPTSVHGATGKHVRHPGVVVGVVGDDFAQSDRPVGRAGGEARGHLHAPLVVADLCDDGVERPVGAHEHGGLLHGSSSGQLGGVNPRSSPSALPLIKEFSTLSATIRRSFLDQRGRERARRSAREREQGPEGGDLDRGAQDVAGHAAEPSDAAGHEQTSQGQAQGDAAAAPSRAGRSPASSSSQPP